MLAGNLKSRRANLKMPKALEKELQHEASKKGLKGKRKAAFVYGTMRKTGWVPSREKKARGRG